MILALLNIFFLLIIFTKNINTVGKTHVILPLLNIFLFISFTKNINTEGKTHDSAAIGEHIRRNKMMKWKKLKRGKLENNVNVVFNSNVEKHLLTKLDEME